MTTTLLYLSKWNAKKHSQNYVHPVKKVNSAPREFHPPTGKEMNGKISTVVMNLVQVVPSPGFKRFLQPLTVNNPSS